MHLRIKDRNNRLLDHLFFYVSKKLVIAFSHFYLKPFKIFCYDFSSRFDHLSLKGFNNKNIFLNLQHPFIFVMFFVFHDDKFHFKFNFTNTRSTFFSYYLLLLSPKLISLFKNSFLNSLSVWVNRGKRYISFKGFVLNVLRILLQHNYIFVHFHFQFGVCKGTRSVVFFNFTNYRLSLFYRNKSTHNKEKLK